jgi:hypothetical protein
VVGERGKGMLRTETTVLILTGSFATLSLDLEFGTRCTTTGAQLRRRRIGGFYGDRGGLGDLGGFLERYHDIAVDGSRKRLRGG